MGVIAMILTWMFLGVFGLMAVGFILGALFNVVLSGTGK